MAKRVYKQAEETNEDKIRKMQMLIWQHEECIKKRQETICTLNKHIADGKRTLETQHGGTKHHTVAFELENCNKFIVDYTGFIADLNEQIAALLA